MYKLKSILLVDDDTATNFLHKIMIGDADCTEQVHVSTNGKQALEYLNDCYDNNKQLPDLIFLDINMPVMDGWDFLEEYEKLAVDIRVNTKLVMLTTSINPDDEVRARKSPVVNDFRNKPLSVELLHEVIETHFP